MTIEELDERLGCQKTLITRLQIQLQEAEVELERLNYRRDMVDQYLAKIAAPSSIEDESNEE